MPLCLSKADFLVCNTILSCRLVLHFNLYNQLPNLTTSIWKRRRKYSFLHSAVPNFSKAYGEECQHTPAIEIWTPDFADEPENFPRYLETTYRESMLDLEWKNLREATSACSTNFSNREFCPLQKLWEQNYTQKHEKVAWKQTELNRQRNSKVFWGKFHSV